MEAISLQALGFITILPVNAVSREVFLKRVLPDGLKLAWLLAGADGNCIL